MGIMIKPEKEIVNIKNWIKDYFAQNGPGHNAIIGISGGKDSTIAAKLLVDALGKDRVIGVKMPCGIQHDINVSNEVIDYLGIKSYEVNIQETCNAYYTNISQALYGQILSEKFLDKRITTNVPARMRMNVLYGIAALNNGRVVNTCNFSEDYIGYSTKFGDAAGDFAFLKGFTVREVKAIGYALGLSNIFVEKIPEDGMTGNSDEKQLGFSYKLLDDFLLDGIYPSADIYEKIENLHKNNLHKELNIPMYLPHCRYDENGTIQSSFKSASRCNSIYF